MNQPIIPIRNRRLLQLPPEEVLEKTVIERLEARGLLQPIADIVLDNGATMYEVCSRLRMQRIVAARHAAWRYLRKRGFSTPEIGRLWSVDSSTVVVATKGKKK